MDWVPIVFVVFKALVLVTGMYYAIKWHYDQGKKGKLTERGAVLRASGKVVAIFMLSLLVLGGFTFVLVSVAGLDMGFPWY
jgi:hypothetical protein